MLRLLFVTLALILFACVPQTPIPIIVTPTPLPTLTAGAVAVNPTAAETQVQPALVVTTTPGDVPSHLATDDTTNVRPSVTPIDTGPYGSIIGPDYELPPTSTPRPTRTPTALPPSATPTRVGTPVATPLEGEFGLNSDMMGVQLYYNMDVDGWKNVMALTGQTRVGWVKLQASWRFLQPDYAGQFDQDFALFEQHVEAAKRQGYKVLLSIAKAPRWARNIDANEDGPPDNPQDLANFIGFMLERMNDTIDAIEIWNEPNLKREWTGGYAFSCAGYMELFRAVYDGIRAVNPNIMIVTAGLAPTGDSDVSVDDRKFLQQMYDAGLAEYTDNVAIGIHPYSWGNPPDDLCCDRLPDRGWDDDPHFFFMNNLMDMREIMERNGHEMLTMWATEFGWATWDGLPTQLPDGQDWMAYNSPQLQSDYTMRAFQIGQSLEYMGPMFLWNLNFANDTLIENRSEIAAYSLLLPPLNSGRPIQERPLYWALVNRP